MSQLKHVLKHQIDKRLTYTEEKAEHLFVIDVTGMGLEDKHLDIIRKELKGVFDNFKGRMTLYQGIGLDGVFFLK